MKTYYYITHASIGSFKIEAENDEDALKQLREKYGEHLVGVMILWTTTDSATDSRTVWLE